MHRLPRLSHSWAPIVQHHIMYATKGICENRELEKEAAFNDKHAMDQTTYGHKGLVQWLSHLEYYIEWTQFRSWSKLQSWKISPNSLW